jgi:hypothetical protein
LALFSIILFLLRLQGKLVGAFYARFGLPELVCNTFGVSGLTVEAVSTADFRHVNSLRIECIRHDDPTVVSGLEYSRDLNWCLLFLSTLSYSHLLSFEERIWKEKNCPVPGDRVRAQIPQDIAEQSL